jgi:preprotein translocase subunit YajC
MFIMLGGLVVVFILMNRKNKKTQQKTADFRQSLTQGQRVMTVGGMVGTITQVNGDVLTLMSANGDQTEYVRRAIRELVDDDMWDNMTQPYPTDDDDEAEADDSTAIEQADDDGDDGDDDDAVDDDDDGADDPKNGQGK